MNGPLPNRFEFDAFRLEPSKRLLWRNGQSVPLTPKAFEVLLVLVGRHGQTVTKQELLDAVWHDTVVEENNLNVNISALRKLFGEKPHEHHFIVTVPGVGYQFVADVREVWHEPFGAGTTAQPTAFVVKEVGAEAARSKAAGVEEAVVGPLQVKARWYQRKFLLGSGAIVVLIVVGFSFYRRNGPTFRSSQPAPFQNTKIIRLTTSGNATTSAISPDGRYVVYELDEGGKKSLWLRQVDVASSMRLTTPADDEHYGLIFSHDGNYIYHLVKGVLYQVTVLGQAKKKLVENVRGSVSLSPDDRRIAFYRFHSFQNEPDQHELLLANADGTGEQRLAVRLEPHFFGWFRFSGPAWSPDGKSIACITMSMADKQTKASVIIVNIANGKEQTFTSQEWEYINQIAWLPDGSGLLFVGRDHASSLFQIWHLDYPGGTARRVTSDLNNYYNVSLSGDGRTLTAVQRTQLQNLWIAPAGQPERAAQITAGTGTYFLGSWTPDGKIVYDSQASGNADIWIMDADGANQKQLTNNAYQNYASTVSPDNRYVLFHSNRTGTWQIWRANIDGSNPMQLTESDSEANLPQVSPDSRWVAYRCDNVICKVPIDGGAPIKLTNRWSERAVFSPDGKYLACWYWDEQKNTMSRLAIVPANGGIPVKFLSVPEYLKVRNMFFMSELRWTPDGRALAYLASRDGVTHIWQQPLEGGPPQQLTSFSSEQVFSFDWSRDNRLVISRGFEKNDVILLKDLR
jgi:Tol biopolymer transport system component/DNA-binding winged helix-turn-helix (wHTH) protein